MRRRSNLLVLLGLASFVLGLIAVYLITGDDDDGGGGGADSVAVLVAREDVAAGTLGDDAIASGAVEVIQVDVADRLPDAVSSASQVSGTRFTQLFPAGEQIRIGGVAPLGGPQARIPEGFEAVALEVGFVAGGANTIAPNDRVNIYQLVTNLGATVDEEGVLVSAGLGGETVKLLLTNVLVLDVQRGTPDLSISAASTDPATGAASNPETLIVVVAVTAVDAEKVIYGFESPTDPFRGIYLSRVRLDDDGNPPPPAVGSDTGRSLENILTQSAADAFADSNATP